MVFLMGMKNGPRLGVVRQMWDHWFWRQCVYTAYAACGNLMAASERSWIADIQF